MTPGERGLHEAALDYVSNFMAQGGALPQYRKEPPPDGVRAAAIGFRLRPNDLPMTVVGSMDDGVFKIGDPEVIVVDPDRIKEWLWPLPARGGS